MSLQHERRFSAADTVEIDELAHQEAVRQEHEVIEATQIKIDISLDKIFDAIAPRSSFIQDGLSHADHLELNQSAGNIPGTDRSADPFIYYWYRNELNALVDPKSDPRVRTRIFSDAKARIPEFRQIDHGADRSVDQAAYSPPTEAEFEREDKIAKEVAERELHIRTLMSLPGVETLARSRAHEITDKNDRQRVDEIVTQAALDDMNGKAEVDKIFEDNTEYEEWFKKTTDVRTLEKIEEWPGPTQKEFHQRMEKVHTDTKKEAERRLQSFIELGEKLESNPAVREKIYQTGGEGKISNLFDVNHNPDRSHSYVDKKIKAVEAELAREERRRMPGFQIPIIKMRMYYERGNKQKGYAFQVQLRDGDVVAREIKESVSGKAAVAGVAIAITVATAVPKNLSEGSGGSAPTGSGKDKIAQVIEDKGLANNAPIAEAAAQEQAEAAQAESAAPEKSPEERRADYRAKKLGIEPDQKIPRKRLKAELNKAGRWAIVQSQEIAGEYKHDKDGVNKHGVKTVKQIVDTAMDIGLANKPTSKEVAEISSEAAEVIAAAKSVQAARKLSQDVDLTKREKRMVGKISARLKAEGFGPHHRYNVAKLLGHMVANNIDELEAPVVEALPAQPATETAPAAPVPVAPEAASATETAQPANPDALIQIPQEPEAEAPAQEAIIAPEIQAEQAAAPSAVEAAPAAPSKADIQEMKEQNLDNLDALLETVDKLTSNVEGTGAYDSYVDKFMKVLAFRESGGVVNQPGSAGGARGKYQYIDSTWASHADTYYSPASRYARADLAPEEIQDALVYREYKAKFESFPGSGEDKLFKLAVSHFYPIANQQPSLLDVVPPSNVITPRQYAEDTIRLLKSGGDWENIKLHYMDAPGFEDMKQRIEDKERSLHEQNSGKEISGARNLGVHTIYVDGQQHQQRLYAIEGLKSTSEESQPGSTYYIDGANGDVIVNQSVAEKLVEMFAAAQKDGINLSAVSSFRTDEHQTSLWHQMGQNTAVVAAPGQSNHQSGTAIDFSLNGLPIQASYYSFEGKSRVAPQSETWRWLRDNAHKFGFEQYYNEPWHWSINGH